LAVSLWTLFNETGDLTLLDESINLERQIVRLRPQGHPRHARSCRSLAVSLRTRFNATGDAALLNEARLLFTQAMQERVVSPSDSVRIRVELALIHLLNAYPFYDVPVAVSLLSEAIKYPVGLPGYVSSICDALHLCNTATLSHADVIKLLGVYQAVIEVLPQRASFVLDKPLRLQRWHSTHKIPLEAFLHSLRSNNVSLGLELLEQGRAVLWSQTLGVQDPQLQGLPDHWKTRIQTLLQSINSFVERPDVRESNMTARERAHGSYSRLQQLLPEIRASPGLERFMRGPSYSELAQVASAHPVIILAAGDIACHALVMSCKSGSPRHVVLDRIAVSELEHLGHDVRGLDLNIRAASGFEASTNEDRLMAISGRRKALANDTLCDTLKRLWFGIVKPILDSLGLEVRRLKPISPFF
jgi:hypothetical protein